MSQIKPEVGQIWKCTLIEDSLDIDSISGRIKISEKEINLKYKKYYIFEIINFFQLGFKCKTIYVSDSSHFDVKYQINNCFYLRFDYFNYPNRKYLYSSMKEYLASKIDFCSSSSYGVACVKCKAYNEYAQVNQIDSSFICYSCRN